MKFRLALSLLMILFAMQNCSTSKSNKITLLSPNSTAVNNDQLASEPNIGITVDKFVFYVTSDGKITGITDLKGNEIMVSDANQNRFISQKYKHRFLSHNLIPGSAYIASIEKTKIQYWQIGWGPKEGKVASIGKIEINYWEKGWGEKEGKIKSIGDIEVNYWDHGWGPKEGKIESVGNIKINYWEKGWGEKEGKIKSVEGVEKNVVIQIKSAS